MDKRLNLGCGRTWRDYPYDGIDIKDFGQTHVCDAIIFLEGAEPNTYEDIMSMHFLEHFIQDDVIMLLNAVHRVLVPKGIFRVNVPHKDNERANMLTHKTFWTESTFKQLSEKNIQDDYGISPWEIVSLIVNERKDIHADLRPIK